MTKNKLASAVLAFVFVFSSSVIFAAPQFSFTGHAAMSFPGEQELRDLHGTTQPDVGIYVYGGGLELNYAPVKYFSIGIGADYAYKTYIDTFEMTRTIIEPYLVARGYLPVSEAFEIYAGGGGGYALMIAALSTETLGGTTFAEYEGSGITYMGLGGILIKAGRYLFMIEGGYKGATVSPYNRNAVKETNADTSDAYINFGGPFVKIGVGAAFGEEPVSYAPSGASTKKEESYASYDDEDEVYDGEEEKDAVKETKAEEAEEEKKETAAAEEQDREKIEIDTESDDNEGIIILSPGETELEKLEKYIVSKRRVTTPRRKEIAYEGEYDEEDEEITFEYGQDEDVGVIVVEAEDKGEAVRAGYVLVERGGFISRNFKEDGIIYSFDDSRTILTVPDFAYVKVTVGKGVGRGTRFVIFNDDESVYGTDTDEYIGKMINIVGVAKVVSKVKDNIFKVQLVKSYEPIKNNYKIKARTEIKDYHRKVSTVVKKKSSSAEGFIIKSKGEGSAIKEKDIVYIDLGVKDGIYPGDRMGVYRKTESGDGETKEKYHKIGSLLVINSVHNSSVGIITSQDEIINAGDIVKTTGK